MTHRLRDYVADFAICLACLGLVLWLMAEPGTTVETPASGAPAPAGAPTAVSSESGYAAFPNVERVGQRRWVAYRYGQSHAGPGGRVRVSFADPGKGFSAPVTVTPASTLYAYGPAGMDADPAGRLYLGIARNEPTGPNTAKNHSTWLTWLDPGSATWAPRVRVPDVDAGFTVASSVLVHGSRVLVTTYGPSGAAVSAYDPATGTWERLASGIRARDASGNVRNTAEPTLAMLAGGSLLMLLRSDGSVVAGSSPPRHYYSYLYATRSTDGHTWAAPWPIVTHATGMPNAETLPTGEVLVMFRGFSTPVGDPLAFPLRVAMLNAEGKPARATTEQAFDVLGGEDARMMYADLLPGAGDSPPELVYSLESREGSVATAAATLYSLPLTFREVSR